MNVDNANRIAQSIDAAYERARLNGNTAGMEIAANELLDLLLGYAKIIRDKNKLDEVREGILRNSRNIAPIIRRVEREPPVPGPDGRTPRRTGIHTYVLEDVEESERDREGEDAE